MLKENSIFVKQNTFNFSQIIKEKKLSYLQDKGIYLMRCNPTNDTYIGATNTCFRSNWIELGRQGKKPNNKRISKKLNYFWLEYEDTDFSFTILEKTNDLFEAKLYYLSLYQPTLNTNNPPPIKPLDYRYRVFPSENQYVSVCERFPQFCCYDSKPKIALKKIITLIYDFVEETKLTGERIPLPSKMLKNYKHLDYKQ